MPIQDSVVALCGLSWPLAHSFEAIRGSICVRAVRNSAMEGSVIAFHRLLLSKDKLCSIHCKTKRKPPIASLSCLNLVIVSLKGQLNQLPYALLTFCLSNHTDLAVTSSSEIEWASS